MAGENTADIRKAMYKSIELEMSTDENNCITLGTFDVDGEYEIELKDTNGLSIFSCEMKGENEKIPTLRFYNISNHLDTDIVISCFTYPKSFKGLIKRFEVISLKFESAITCKVYSIINSGYIDFSAGNYQPERISTDFVYYTENITADKKITTDGLTSDSKYVNIAGYGNNYYLPIDGRYGTAINEEKLGISSVSVGGNYALVPEVSDDTTREIYKKNLCSGITWPDITSRKFNFGTDFHHSQHPDDELKYLHALLPVDNDIIFSEKRSSCCWRRNNHKHRCYARW